MKRSLVFMASAALFLTALVYTSYSKASAEHKVAPAPVAPPCSGEAYKLVNGVCEAGQQIWLRSEWDDVNHYYRCYYKYKWSDTTESGEYFIISYPGCI